MLGLNNDYAVFFNILMFGLYFYNAVFQDMLILKVAVYSSACFSA